MPNAENLVLPFVHMNGTSKQKLLELREAVYAALLAAGEALAQMGPNARDYYPEPGRFERAVAQHQRRLVALRGLVEEIEAETIAVDYL